MIDMKISDEQGTHHSFGGLDNFTFNIARELDLREDGLSLNEIHENKELIINFGEPMRKAIIIGLRTYDRLRVYDSGHNDGAVERIEAKEDNKPRVLFRGADGTASEYLYNKTKSDLSLRLATYKALKQGKEVVMKGT